MSLLMFLSECQKNTNLQVISAAMAGKVHEAGKLSMALVTMLFGTTIMLIMSICIEAQDPPVPHNMVILINKMGSPFTVHCTDGPNDLGFSEVVDTYSHDFHIPIDHQGDVFACTFYAEGFQPTHVELASIRVYCEVCTWTVKPSGFYNNMGNWAAGWA